MNRIPFGYQMDLKHPLVGRRVSVGVFKDRGTVLGVQADGTLAIESDRDRNYRLENPNPQASVSISIHRPEAVEFLD